MNTHRLIVALLCCLAVVAQAAPLTVTDDLGHSVTLAQPAQRIVSLAPHATEILYAAGLGTRIVGAVSYSDYPPQAREIPRVGGYNNLDVEHIAALAPDLVVGWREGNHPAQLDTLRRLGLTLYISDPHELDAVASTLERLGQLGATEQQAAAAATAYRLRLAELRARYARQPPITVFYQVWNRPLMTVNDQHLIGKVLTLCGGRNVFGTLGTVTPTVSEEAVLQAAPEVIVASGMGESRPEWLDDWRRWQQLPAVRLDNLYFIPPDILQRHGPRLLTGAAQLCARLEEARARRQP
ncbi:cobalamin-binding protein [Sulfurivermis fontis]|uniref:cobalamin-binding protein n=1 Tax=Sulfurivermis fontis TaxID=1972068 RepID=UPI0018D55C85|nr:cobalamin-binding protein [Sulfurivermis fontis]